jgi:hypothetical protein
MAVSPTEKRAQTRAARDTPRIFLSRRRKSNALAQAHLTASNSRRCAFELLLEGTAPFLENPSIYHLGLLGLSPSGGVSPERRPVLSTHGCRNQPHAKIASKPSRRSRAYRILQQ